MWTEKERRLRDSKVGNFDTIAGKEFLPEKVSHEKPKR